MIEGVGEVRGTTRGSPWPLALKNDELVFITVARSALIKPSYYSLTYKYNGFKSYILSECLIKWKRVAPRLANFNLLFY